MTKQEFVAYAKTFLGIPYIWGGMSKIGADCSGLATMLMHHAGFNCPRMSAAGMYLHYLVHGERISPNQLDVGDLCFYAKNKHVIHVAVGVGHGLVIEAAHGGRWSISRAIARLRGAKVIIGSETRHPGLCAVIRPKGLPWVS